MKSLSTALWREQIFNSPSPSLSNTYTHSPPSPSLFQHTHTQILTHTHTHAHTHTHTHTLKWQCSRLIHKFNLCLIITSHVEKNNSEITHRRQPGSSSPFTHI